MQHETPVSRFRTTAAAVAGAFALAFAALFLGAPANAYAEPVETIDVTNLSSYGISTSANGADSEEDSTAINEALSKAAEFEGEVEVRIPAGTYLLANRLKIRSNTTLKLEEGTLVKPKDPKGWGDTNGLIVSEPDSGHAKDSGYTRNSNLTIIGGTWDRADTAGSYDSGIVYITNSTNITIKDATFKNCANHMVTLNACDKVTVTGCTFADQRKYIGDSEEFWGSTKYGDASRIGSTEALHTDYLGSIPTCNVTVDNCTFTNVLSGVGTHHPNANHAKNYTVTNCTFANLMMYAMKGYDFENVLFQGNTVTNSPYMVFTERCKGFNVKDNTAKNISAIGVNFRQGTTGTVSGNTITVSSSGEAVVRVADGSATVSGNTLSGAKKGIGSVNSKTTMTGNKVYCPKGTALYVYGGSATVEKNTVTAAGIWGIGLDNKVKSGKIKGNTVKGARTGITIRKYTKSVSISGNKIYSTKDNGIYLDTSCSATISGNLVSKPGRSAVRVAKKSSASIKKNTLSATKSHAINADGSSVTATSNKITASKGCGILFKKGKLKASGNTITAKKGAGITVENASKGSYVNSNTVSASKGKGIFVKSAKSCQIMKNKVKKAKMFGIHAEGTKKAPCKVRVKSNKVTAKGLSKKIYVGSYAKKY